MEKKYIMALDQGTTSSRAVIFDRRQNVVAIAKEEFPQAFPHPGWVEHNPFDILNSQKSVVLKALRAAGISPEEVAAAGITNQRETTVMWDKNTGLPVCNAIVWQCRRTADICEELKARGLNDYIKSKTGLLADAYFSGTKIKWILDNIPGARTLAEKGDLLFGTVDTWLLWNLTGVHATDYTNASRTMLFDIHTLSWDKKLCKELDIPLSVLPAVYPSSHRFGSWNIDGVAVPVCALAGDQQASLFGQACFEKGETKNTYGTGCFMLMNTGNAPCTSHYGLITTLAAGCSETPTYALEGSVFTGGAVIQWLRDELKIITDAAQTEEMASSLPDNGGVYIVPAFTGLGAPYWDMYAKGTILGITRGTTREHIVRAALESIAFQSAELISCMENDTGIKIASLRVDGGASENSFLMQFQSDISGKRVQRPAVMETTALGAAGLAGLACGFWNSFDELKDMWQCKRVFAPQKDDRYRACAMKTWHSAVLRSAKL